MTFDEVDMIKIAIAVGSVIALYLFRRKINLLVTDFIANGGASRHENESSEEIIERIEARIEEVIR